VAGQNLSGQLDASLMPSHIICSLKISLGLIQDDRLSWQQGSRRNHRLLTAWDVSSAMTQPKISEKLLKRNREDDLLYKRSIENYFSSLAHDK
jgi:hypothetical protein